MQRILVLLLMLVVSPQVFSKTNCFPNSIKTDLCQKAREFSNYMATQLPIKLNKNVSWVSVASIDTAIIAYYVFTYDREYLMDIFEKKGASVDEAKEAMKTSASNICSQEEWLEAFISLGGEFVANYSFSDGELFLRHIVKKCK